MPPARLLRGTRVRLTALTKEDLPTLARWTENPEYLHLADSAPAAPRSPGQVGREIAEVQRDPKTYMFAIRPLEGNALLGTVDLSDIEWNNRVSWLGIGVGEPAFWDKGYGGEAMRLVLDFGFSELNLYRIQLTVFATNPRAIALYERLGFQREGNFREFLERDGQRHDMLLYGLLRHEWQAARRVP